MFFLFAYRGDGDDEDCSSATGDGNGVGDGNGDNDSERLRQWEALGRSRLRQYADSRSEFGERLDEYLRAAAVATCVFR